MRKLIIKNFVLEWKFESNPALLLVILFIGFIPPALVINQTGGIILSTIITLLLITGLVLIHKRKYSFIVSVARPATFIHPVLMIAGTLLIKHPENNYIGVISVVVSLLLCLLPKIVALKTIKWDELDSSQKWQLGTLYKQGMNRSGNIHMSSLDWEQWSVLNSYYFEKYNYLNK